MDMGMREIEMAVMTPVPHIALSVQNLQLLRPSYFLDCYRTTPAPSVGLSISASVICILITTITE